MRYFKAPQPLLFIGAALIAFYFSSLLALSFWGYFPLSAEAKANVFQWEVVEIKEKYPIKATYSFEANGKIWKNSFIFSQPWSWNQPSAIILLKEKAKQPWSVWYSPNNPALSALEKSFPYNLFFRTLVCYAVLIYFALLYRKFLISNRS
jgi:hypothetical protein